RSGAHADALATYFEADAIYRDQLKTGPPEWHARTLVGIGRTLSERSGEDARAERALRDALERITTPPTRISALRVEAQVALAEVLLRSGRGAEARRLLDAAKTENAAAPRTLPVDPQQMLQRAAVAAAGGHRA